MLSKVEDIDSIRYRFQIETMYAAESQNTARIMGSQRFYLKSHHIVTV
jgi:hypothetical protein